MSIDLDRLKANLLTSGLHQKDKPLYQVINQLIDAAKLLQAQVDSLKASGGINADLLFLTSDDESSNLPFSKELVAGDNITFDDSIANRRTINSADGAIYAPLTDGDDFETSLIFSDGDCVMVRIY